MAHAQLLRRLPIAPPFARDSCKLDPLVVVATIFNGSKPCDRCDVGGDRSECGGTPRKQEQGEQQDDQPA